MINVKGVLRLRATTDGGVEISVMRDGLVVVGPIELSGLEWRQVNDLLRQDAKVAALLAEAQDQHSDVEGITWTP